MEAEAHLCFRLLTTLQAWRCHACFCIFCGGTQPILSLVVINVKKMGILLTFHEINVSFT